MRWDGDINAPVLTPSSYPSTSGGLHEKARLMRAKARWANRRHYLIDLFGAGPGPFELVIREHLRISSAMSAP